MKKIRVYFRGTRNFREYLTNGSLQDAKYQFVKDEYFANWKDAKTIDIVNKTKQVMPYLRAQKVGG